MKETKFESLTREGDEPFNPHSSIDLTLKSAHRDMHSLLMSVKTTYERALLKHPFVTHTGQAAFLMGFGDALAQQYEHKQDADYTRTARMCCIGSVFGPALAIYYKYLNKLVTPRKSVSAARNNLFRICVDQLVVAPISIGVIVALTSVAEGKDPLQSVYTKEPPLLIDNYKIWPAAQVVNFYVLPPHFRPSFHQVVAVFWNALMSWKLHEDDLPDRVNLVNHTNSDPK